MGATVHASVQPATLVRASTSTTLYFRLAVTNTAATLVSLLTNSVLPTIVNPRVSGPAGSNYVFKGVWLQSETAFGTAAIRYTADGQTVPTATLGMQVNDLTMPAPTVIMADPQDIQLIGSVAGPTYVQCYLVIGGTSVGVN